ncbi:MAG: endonuclease/exonuclease/phosphatase family protein [Deltaproteobacteria bacterium]|nr:endonuclease/exonuclease/phosphatase family protein [Deltaproteobacteria bacterium]
MAAKRGIDAVAAAIARLDADVVGLQEVDVGTRRSGGVDVLAALAQRLGWHAAFGKAMDFDGGGYGVGLLSRVPLEAVRTVPLAGAPGAEPRALLLARVDLDGGRWTVGVTHLASVLDGPQAAELRRQQARTIAETLGGRDATILLGDLNAPFDETTLTPLSIVGAFAGLDAGPTYPAPAPTLRLDHIVFSPDLWQIGARVVDTGISDHRALVARIAQKPAR